LRRQPLLLLRPHIGVQVEARNEAPIKEERNAVLNCLRRARLDEVTGFGSLSKRAIQNTDIMNFTKNIGMVLLAVYLIVDGLLGFGLHLGPFIFLLYIVALAAGVFILIGK